MTAPQAQPAEPLEFARSLVRAGVPVFPCPPGGRVDGYHLPLRWQTTQADEAALERWEPGWALAAVCGVQDGRQGGVDVIDLDPRNGGDWNTLQAAVGAHVELPQVLGIVGTVSAGVHLYVAAQGLGKGPIAKGVDYQAGTGLLDGSSTKTDRGFVWLPPTTRLSKYGPNEGLVVPYLAAAPFRPGGSVSESFKHWVLESRSRPVAPSADKIPLSGLGEPIPEGAHEGTLFRYASSLRARGVPEGEAALLVDARARDCVGRCDKGGHGWEKEGRPAYRRYEAGESVEPLDVTPFSAPRLVIVPDLPGFVEPEADARTAAERLGALDSRDLGSILPPTPLLAGVLDVSTLAVLVGKFGTYKTFVALGWAASLATGRGWGPFSVPERRRVVYVAAEGASGVRARLAAWEAAHEPVEAGWLTVVPRAVRLDRPQDVADLVEVAQGAGLVVLDTLHKMAPGAEEQSAKEMGVVHSVMEAIRSGTGATVLAVHHTGHSGERSRGSSAIEDDADTVWLVKLGGDGEDRSASNPRTIVQRKVKDAEAGPDRRLIFSAAEDSGYVLPGAIETRLTKEADKERQIWEILERHNVHLDPCNPDGSIIGKNQLARQARALDLGISGDDGIIRGVVATWWNYRSPKTYPKVRPTYAPPPPEPTGLDAEGFG